jgi:hypothetical protein
MVYLIKKIHNIARYIARYIAGGYIYYINIYSPMLALRYVPYAMSKNEEYSIHLKKEGRNNG